MKSISRLILSLLLIMASAFTMLFNACTPPTPPGPSGPTDYTVNFMVDDEVYYSTEAGEGQITFPTEPTKTGYIFDDWYFDKDVWTDALSSEYVVTTNITVFARWVPDTPEWRKYTVTFISNDNVFDTVKCFGEKLIQLPGIPELEGYVFDGWYADRDVWEIPVNSDCLLSSPMTRNISAYARFRVPVTEGLVYELNDTEDAYIVVNYTGKSDVVDIPKKHNGLPVTEVGYSAFRCKSLRKVSFPNGMIRIGDLAFSYVKGLETIYIPGSVKEIGKSCFHENKSLSTVTLCKGLEMIDGGAFRYSAFSNIYIPDSVTGIFTSVFSGCSLLSNIRLSKNLVYLGVGSYGKRPFPDVHGVFQGCSSLIHLDIPDTVTHLGMYSFSFCTSLESIVIPKSITWMPHCFHDCNSLNAIYYGGTPEEWDNINRVYLYYSPDGLDDITRYYYSETEPTDDGNYWHYVNDTPQIW